VIRPVAPSRIETPRLDLLPLHVEHAHEMARVLSDAALHTFIGGEPEGPEALRRRYTRLTAGSPDPAVVWLNWVIRLRAEGCLAGTVQATVTSSAEGQGQLTAEVAWVVGTPWQGRGVATEAARALVEWLTRPSEPVPLPVRTVIAHIHPDHLASEGVARAAGLAPTGEWHDGEVRWRTGRTGR
jgi:RimJ/RimL family protein N-acetyltransferase